ncbi:nitrile hydratase subunit beta [Pseudooceanicola sp. LIPI14-2-Ac024]|uniref:nitrile hydratase subunit beta n=1 Tax=Pseudooceanicola sp. LIPI14-2-Ac024 TaxID=3344875 RepID=UPI0035D04B08
MNGPHDIGGHHGFGPVDPAANDAPYHPGAEDWEERAMALTVASGFGGHWTIDESRFAREDRHPLDYHSLGYFGIWLAGLKRLLVERNLVTEDELAGGPLRNDTAAPNPPLPAAKVPAALARGGPVDRDPGPIKPIFSPGDRVRTRNIQPRGHTRLPAYARDKVGRIETVQGYHAYADDSARGDRAAAHWLYTVVFDATVLFGDAAATGDTVTIDAWEPYLERL